MALFIVRHQHEAERCPATDPYAGARLLNYLNRLNVRQRGIEIQDEAVVQGEHTFYIILESPEVERVRDFMKPFAAAGSVDIYPASTCATVVASGGCAAQMWSVPGTASALDPEEACQRAIEAGLLVHRAHPLTCETSIPALIGGVLMPSAHFYVRNHFQISNLDSSAWRLDVQGSESYRAQPCIFAWSRPNGLAGFKRDVRHFQDAHFKQIDVRFLGNDVALVHCDSKRSATPHEEPETRP